MAQKLKPNRSDNRGGSPNCGRKKLGNKLYQRRIHPDLIPLMDKCLEALKKNPDLIPLMDEYLEKIKFVLK